MSLFHILILAVVQGITEFLPVSSSGHLILTHRILENANSGAWNEDLVLDLAVHIGSLLSVLIYFHKDIALMLRGLLNLACGGRENTDARLALFLITASIPVLVLGFLLHLLEPSWLRSVKVVAWCTLIFGILLWLVDKKAPVQKKLSEMTLKSAVTIGLAQALALVPGTSRSGITMTAARSLGFSRSDAARFSFLLSTIATTAAGFIGIMEMIEIGSLDLTLNAFFAVMFSFAASLFTIAFLMKFLQKSTFMPFAAYRVILGIALLFLVYSGLLA